MLSWLEKGTLKPYKLERPISPGAYKILIEEEPDEVIRVFQIMHRHPITVDSNAKVQEALSLMKDRDIHHLPVLSEEGAVVGLVSDRDLYDTENRAQTLVNDIMTVRLLTALEDSAIWLVGQIMLSNRVNCVLVVNSEQMLLGIITSLDILACMTYQAPIEVWAY
jgi:CBS domain-containing protein